MGRYFVVLSQREAQKRGDTEKVELSADTPAPCFLFSPLSPILSPPFLFSSVCSIFPSRCLFLACGQIRSAQITAGWVGPEPTLACAAADFPVPSRIAFSLFSSHPLPPPPQRRIGTVRTGLPPSIQSYSPRCQYSSILEDWQQKDQLLSCLCECHVVYLISAV